jgi:hypothetical protein
MRLKRASPWVTSAVWIALWLLVDGYMFCRVTAEPQTGLTSVRVEKIAVMPFLKGKHDSDTGETLNCPICELYFSKERISSDADQILTRYVQEALENRPGVKLIPLEKMIEAYERISKDEAKDTPRTLARRLGKALGANLIITGTVWRFRDRVGDTPGGYSGASVAFSVYLIDVASGGTLWKAKFDETQRPVSENISGVKGLFRRGFKWLSASELAGYGVEEIFKKSPL